MSAYGMPRSGGRCHEGENKKKLQELRIFSGKISPKYMLNWLSLSALLRKMR